MPATLTDEYAKLADIIIAARAALGQAHNRAIESEGREDNDTLATWSVAVAERFLELASDQLDGTIDTRNHRVAIAYAVKCITSPDARLGDGVENLEREDLLVMLRALTGDQAW
jgi:hypothetical protein